MQNDKSIYNIFAMAIFFIAMIGWMGISERLLSLSDDVETYQDQIEISLKKKEQLISEVGTDSVFFDNNGDTISLRLVKALNGLKSAIKSDDIRLMYSANYELDSSLTFMKTTAVIKPEVKESEHYIELINELQQNEEMLKSRVELYNNSVSIYNDAIQLFPSNIVAYMLRLNQKNYFAAT